LSYKLASDSAFTSYGSVAVSGSKVSLSGLDPDKDYVFQAYNLLGISRSINQLLFFTTNPQRYSDLQDTDITGSCYCPPEDTSSSSSSSTTPGTPTIITPKESSLCHTGLHPQLINGILIQIARRHFADAKYIQEPLLRKYTWSPNPELSNLLIENSNFTDVTKVGIRPAILCKRNPQQPIKVAIGNKSLTGFAELQPPYGGTDYYESYRKGSSTYFCISRNKGEAELLSDEWNYALTVWAPIIRAEFGFHEFEVAEEDALSRLEEEDSHFVVPITVSYIYHAAWTVNPEAPLLKTIALSINT
jgi:hypothetical protein